MSNYRVIVLSLFTLAVYSVNCLKLDVLSWTKIVNNQKEYNLIYKTDTTSSTVEIDSYHPNQVNVDIIDLGEKVFPVIKFHCRVVPLLSQQHWISKQQFCHQLNLYDKKNCYDIPHSQNEESFSLSGMHFKITNNSPIFGFSIQTLWEEEFKKKRTQLHSGFFSCHIFNRFSNLESVPAKVVDFGYNLFPRTSNRTQIVKVNSTLEANIRPYRFTCVTDGIMPPMYRMTNMVPSPFEWIVCKVETGSKMSALECGERINNPSEAGGFIPLAEFARYHFSCDGTLTILEVIETKVATIPPIVLLCYSRFSRLRYFSIHGSDVTNDRLGGFRFVRSNTTDSPNDTEIIKPLMEQNTEIYIRAANYDYPHIHPLTLLALYEKSHPIKFGWWKDGQKVDHKNCPACRWDRFSLTIPKNVKPTYSGFYELKLQNSKHNLSFYYKINIYGPPQFLKSQLSQPLISYPLEHRQLFFNYSYRGTVDEGKFIFNDISVNLHTGTNRIPISRNGLLSFGMPQNSTDYYTSRYYLYDLGVHESHSASLWLKNEFGQARLTLTVIVLPHFDPLPNPAKLNCCPNNCFSLEEEEYEYNCFLNNRSWFTRRELYVRTDWYINGSQINLNNNKQVHSRFEPTDFFQLRDENTSLVLKRFDKSRNASGTHVRSLLKTFRLQCRITIYDNNATDPVCDSFKGFSKSLSIVPCFVPTNRMGWHAGAVLILIILLVMSVIFLFFGMRKILSWRRVGNYDVEEQERRTLNRPKTLRDVWRRLVRRNNQIP